MIYELSHIYIHVTTTTYIISLRIYYTRIYLSNPYNIQTVYIIDQTDRYQKYITIGDQFIKFVKSIGNSPNHQI